MATAAIIESPGADFSIAKVTLGPIQYHELLVRVEAVGLCHTDLSVAGGGLPFPLPGVLGHEGTGIIEQVGVGVTGLSVGDRVVLSFDSCGKCSGCRSGQPAYCHQWLPLNLLSGERTDGSSPVLYQDAQIGGTFFGQSSFATHAVVQERSCVKVETKVDPGLLAPLACGVTTGTGAIWNTLQPQLGDAVLVAGAGTVGLAAIIAAAQTGATQIIAVDLVKERLELAKELGATDVINPTEVDDLVAAVQGLTDRGVDHVVESTGNAELLSILVTVTREQGRVAIVGAPAFGERADFDVNFMLPGRQIIGVTLGAAETQTAIPALASLIEQGRLPVDRLVKTYPLSDINQAVDEMKSGHTIKPVLIP